VLRRYLKLKATKPEERGGQGVGALSSTDEAGEPTQRDLVEGRGRRIVGAFGGKDAGDIEPESVSTGLQRVEDHAQGYDKSEDNAGRD